MPDASMEQSPLSEAARAGKSIATPGRKHLAGTLAGWLLLIGVVLLFKAVIADHYLIPTDSMAPLLRGDPRVFRGDHVLVDKITYGIRLPGTSHWLIRWRQPRRGEIVVFFRRHDSARPVQIKRVAATGGEQVRIQDGSLWIDGKQVVTWDEEGRPIVYTDHLQPDDEAVCRAFLALARENHLPDILNPEHPPVQALRQAMEMAHGDALRCEPDAPELPDACRGLCESLSPAARNTLRHLVAREVPPPRYGLIPSPLFTLVPENACFLLGDNSSESVDGRVWGFTPQADVFGRAVLVWRPPFTFRLLVPSILESPGLILTLVATGFLAAWFLHEIISWLRRRHAIWHHIVTDNPDHREGST